MSHSLLAARSSPSLLAFGPIAFAFGSRNSQRSRLLPLTLHNGSGPGCLMATAELCGGRAGPRGLARVKDRSGSVRSS